MMNKVVVLSVVLSLASTGCYSYTVKTAAPPSAMTSSDTGFTFLWGLVGTDATAPECPNGTAWVETYQPWWGVLVGGLTAGLVTPWKAEWACNAGGTVTRR